MRIFLILCFLLALPPCGILAHDLYLAHQAAEQAHVSFGSKPIDFTDLGWLLVNYSPDTYDWARRTVDADTWGKIIDPMLQQTAMIVTAIPAVTLTGFLIIFKLIKGLPFISGLRLRAQKGKTKGNISIQGLEKSKKKMSYKRK